MQTKSKNKKPIKRVEKPMLKGSFHGADAWKLAMKRFVSVILISCLYLIVGFLVASDQMWISLMLSLAITGLVFYFQYVSGATLGEKDASFAEIMYLRNEEGKPISVQDRDRCFHPYKAFFATFVALIPFLIFTFIFACITQVETYRIGVLPSWTGEYLKQTEVADALTHYTQVASIGVMDICRVMVRAMVMPFITTASAVSKEAVLWVERLSPLLILFAPMGYGFGYLQGPKIRANINTGIVLGVAKKKRKQRKERKARQASSAPERLI